MLKPKSFTLKGRRVTFLRDKAVLAEWCSYCAKQLGRSAGWECDIQERSRSSIRIALFLQRRRKRVQIGCQIFSGAVVAYARRWAKKGTNA